METDSDPLRRPAPYGHACRNCARAKCKCIFGDDHRTCARCLRLKKECIPAPQIRRKKSRVDIERLEQKLDGAISLLRSIAPNNSAVENAIDILDPKVPEYQTATGFSICPQRTPQRNIDEPETACAAHPFLTPASETTSLYPYVLPKDAEPTMKEAELCFKTFCAKNLQHFPFTQFADGMPAKQVREERPFFWLCIMATSSPMIHRQLALGQAIREITAQEILIEGRRNLDFLLGLLCFVGWGQYQMHTSPFFTAYSHLCIAITLDMELHKPAYKENIHVWSARHGFPKSIEIPAGRTMEHRRLALGCYLLTSSLATSQQKVECLSWTPYLEQCLLKLEDTKEYTTDELFVHQIRLQRVVEKATVACLQIRDMAYDESSTMIMLHVQNLKTQFTETKKKILPHLASNRMLQLQMFSTDVIINEIAMYLPNTGSLTLDSAFDRTECLYSCLHAVKSWFDIFLDYETAAYVGFPFSTWKQLFRVFFALYRLTVLSDPTWDTDMVRRTCKSSLLLDRIADNLKQAEDSAMRTYDGPGQASHFTRSTKFIANIKRWVDSLPGFDDTASDPNLNFQYEDQPVWQQVEQRPLSANFPPFEPPDLWSQDFLGSWEMCSESYQDLGRS